MSNIWKDETVSANILCPDQCNVLMTQCWLSDLFPLQCYECDGVKGGGGLCPGNAPWGERQVGNPHNINMYLTLVSLSWFCLIASHCSGWLWGTILWSASGGAAHIQQIVGLVTLSIIRIVTTTLVSRSTVVSSDSRWRRGCTTDGHEMTVFFSSWKN